LVPDARLESQSSSIVYFTRRKFTVSFNYLKILRRFNVDQTSCEEAEPSGRRVPIVGDIRQKFLPKYPFASAKTTS
jgi:hypothetical protein